ncbi:MAG: cytochrome-c oxidase, cbb3-type subunit II [Gemmatimonadota bacterium]|nr:cytochrome-c oxidase, cbb3-type subunit II [Gemmatimonadota bacterium]MDH5283043.1 cytochrome-c oxidase, cbb3-type subunit II [Gemmatimonadota bacterium]
MSDTNARGYTAAHRILEGKSALFAVLVTVAILIGGIVEIVPMFSAGTGPEMLPGVTPYTALELRGRDIYISEGCYTCHSQMVRPTRAEVMRYGEWSRAGEYAYDHPFLLGSRRLGPDLHRVGGKYPDAWHYEHMRDPRSTSPGSVMPPYPWMLHDRYDVADIQASLRALRKVGVPYTDAEIDGAPAAIEAQARGIVDRLATAGITAEPDRDIIAMIAYLQRLGKDGRAALSAGTAATP